MALPHGRITMLFTDIEGSTRMVQDLGPTYAAVLSDQRRIIRRAIADLDGHEMGTEGDSFFVVFASAGAGLHAAVGAQLALGAHRWPADAPVRVRMGLHVGEPDRHEEGYVGVDLNRAARIASTAHGGQIVVSADMRDEAAATPIPGLAFVDLGRHRLKDLPEPEHLFRVQATGLVDVTTPIKSLGAPTNLPGERAPLIGRDDVVERAAAALGGGGRLVTLTGPGGVGKTTTALHVARRLTGERVDGVYFVALEQAREAADAWAAIGRAVGIPEDDGPDGVIDGLAGRPALLVLDNLEQLPAAAPVVSELLDRTPVAVLATSRGAVGVRGEQELPVAILDRGPALELFEREAQRGRPSFAIGPANEVVVTEICRRLDGLPLAIELAAARIRLLSPEQLLDSLSGQLWLRSPDADRPDRQRTLAAAIGWSFDLLEELDQQAFVALAVFVDGADLDAVAAVLAGRAEALDVFDVVGRLARVGLLALADGPDGGVRATMLGAVREFALERFVAAPEADAVARRHAAHFTELAEEAEHHLRGPRHLAWADRLRTEQANLAAAFSWADGTRTSEDRALALRLASALGWFWYSHGRAGEGRPWLERAMAQPVEDERGAPVEPAVLARAAHALGVLQQQQGDNDEAVRSFERALELLRAIGDDSGVARELNSLGVTRWSMSEPEAASLLLEESAAVARRTGDDARLASALSNLGTVALSGGAVDDAVHRFEEAMRLDEALDDRWGLACDRANLGAALVRTGEVARAHRMLVDVLPTSIELDDPDLLASTVEGIALAAASAGRFDHAVVLVAAADALRAAAGIPRAPFDESYLERGLGPARDALSPSDFEAARGAGAGLRGDDLLAVASQPLE